jgi:predicted transcriptional regulator of viral defense system
VKPVDAFRYALVEQGAPVVSPYDLFVLLWKVYRAGEFRGTRISKRRELPDENSFNYFRRKLLKDRYLREDEEFGKDAYRVSDVPDGTAEEITARLNPFCYLSHLSAMQRYGLTVRSPEALTLSMPDNLTAAIEERGRADFGTEPTAEEFRVPLVVVPFPEKVRGRLVRLHRTVRTPVVTQIRGSSARIASIGETFVQMLDQPELCGGMSHVVSVWDEHAKTYVEDIIPAVERATEKIVKVRAGYLLQERQGLTDPRIETWSRFAQRGGSRKLDPSRPYVSKYSEKWMLSLNVTVSDDSP